jgi:uncharacterized Zn finger protein
MSSVPSVFSVVKQKSKVQRLESPSACSSKLLIYVMTITNRERQIFQNMAPADKLSLASQLHMQAREWKKAALRSQHRDWSPEQVDQRVREVFLYGAG